MTLPSEGKIIELSSNVKRWFDLVDIFTEKPVNVQVSEFWIPEGGMSERDVLARLAPGPEIDFKTFYRNAIYRDLIDKKLLAFVFDRYHNRRIVYAEEMQTLHIGAYAETGASCKWPAGWCVLHN